MWRTTQVGRSGSFPSRKWFQQRVLRHAYSLTTFVGITLGGAAKAMDASDLLVYDIGPLTLRPLFDLSETYNDNVLFGGKNLVSDFVTTVTPGIKLQLGQGGGNLISASYLHDEIIYAQENQLSAGQDHFVTGVRYLGNRLSIDGRDQIDSLSTLLGGGYSSVAGVLVDRLTISDRYNVGYEITEKTKAYLAGNFSMTDWGKNGTTLFDSTSFGGTAGFMFKALSKTSFFGEVYYGETVLDANDARKDRPQADFIGGFIGARGDFTDRLTGSAKAGYETRTFGIQDTGAPVVEMDISFHRNDRSVLTLSYQRSQEVSMDLTPNVYTADLATFSFSQSIGAADKLRAQLSLSYGMNSFDPSKTYPIRNDVYYRAGTVLTYNYKPWLATYVSYEFNHFGSDLPVLLDYVYDQNRLTVGMKVGF